MTNPPGFEGTLSDEFVELPVVASERVYSGKIWDVQRETVLFNGAQMTREFVDHTGAVAVLALNARDEVLLIQQYRHPVRRREWEIPAGLLDTKGESPLVTAQRELAEEADLVANDWRLLTDVATTPGGNNEAIRVFLARDLRSTDTEFEREHEEADMVRLWVPLDDVVDAVLERRVHNAALMIAILAAHAARERGWSTLADASSPWPEHAYFGAPNGAAGGGRFVNYEG